MKKTLAAALLLTLGLTGAAFANAPATQTVTAYDAAQTVNVNPAYFTGKAVMQTVFRPQAPSNSYAAFVAFEPGARTYWHIHEKGQTLIVTEGIGYTQEEGGKIVELHPGDVVRCPPGVKHWHGAAPNSSMTHFAISETGKVTWLEPVTDTVYQQK